MKSETAIGAALTDAGFGSHNRLYMQALACIREAKAPNELAVIKAKFTGLVAKDAGLLVELMGIEAIRAAAFHYLQARADEMKSPQGEGSSIIGVSEATAGRLPSPPKIDGVGHEMGAQEGHSKIAGSVEPLGGDGHANAAREGQRNRAASTNPTSSGGQTANAHKGHYAIAPAARPQSIHARAAVAQTVASTLFDSFRVRDGRSIGDVRIGELERLRTTNAMEASVLRQIQRHGMADENARVRDVINLTTLERMVQRAAQVADAA